VLLGAHLRRLDDQHNRPHLSTTTLTITDPHLPSNRCAVWARLARLSPRTANLTEALRGKMSTSDLTLLHSVPHPSHTAALTFVHSEPHL